MLSRSRALLIRLVYAGVALLAIPIIAWNGFVLQLNASWSDILVALHPPPAQSRTSGEITLVTVDDGTAALLGVPPLDRQWVAQALDRIAAQKPRVLAVDLLLSGPTSPASDLALAAALQRSPEIILGAALETNPSGEPRWVLPLPLFGETRLGHVHAAPDPDGVVRTVLLAKTGAGRRYWALGLEVARAASGADIVESADSIALGSRQITALNEDRQMAIRFAGPEGTFRRVSFLDVVEGRADPAALRGKIVLIGVTAQGSGDRFVTPVFSGAGMSGVEIHANVVRSILDQDFLRRADTTTETALYLFLVCGALAAVRYLRGLRRALAVLALVVGSAATFWLALAHGSIVLPAGSMLGVFLFASGISGAGELAIVTHKLSHAEARQQESAFRLQAIAHEIATPLTAIQASSEIISDASLTDQKRIEMAGLIFKESRRLNSVLQTFLDVERMASGKLKIHKTEVALGPLCEEVVRAARLYAARKKTLIDAEIEPVTARADAELLSFAIYNLLTNAVKYSPKESRVQLSVAEAGNAISISVADQGFGIAPEEQTQIFERFYRLNRDRQSSEPGSGIGLALVREIAQQHGGQILIESKPGAGSRFTITLPKD